MRACQTRNCQPEPGPGHDQQRARAVRFRDAGEGKIPIERNRDAPPLGIAVRRRIRYGNQMAVSVGHCHRIVREALKDELVS